LDNDLMQNHYLAQDAPRWTLGRLTISLVSALILNIGTVGTLHAAEVSEPASPAAALNVISATVSAATTPQDTRIADMLVTAMSLIGVDYKFGGNTPETGFDCSGFVRHLFAAAVSMELPRSSMEMSRRGKKIAKDALEAGDLVFYNTRKRAFSHVGIYIGEGRFIHAPSRGKSVETVDMTDSYWVKRFNGARRLFSTKLSTELSTEAPIKIIRLSEISENAAPN
jgi:cell wall-associated NlpC family hydrolase